MPLADADCRFGGASAQLPLPAELLHSQTVVVRAKLEEASPLEDEVPLAICKAVDADACLRARAELGEEEEVVVVVRGWSGLWLPPNMFWELLRIIPSRCAFTSCWMLLRLLVS